MGFFRNAVRNRRLLSKPFLKLIADWVDNEDVWAFQEIELEPHVFGSRYDFWHYLDGESTVRVTSVDEICDWLVECEKTSDLALFNERDYWQHPGTFEELRKGDCEDHALWAWRKLGELGLPAQFVIGRYRWNPEKPSFHAWVTFEDASGFHAMETAASKRSGMLMSLHEATADYIPHVSVGHRRQTRMYGGYIQYRMWEREQEGRPWSGDRYRPLLGE